jgi:hypothetical protein
MEILQSTLNFDITNFTIQQIFSVVPILTYVSYGNKCLAVDHIIQLCEPKFTKKILTYHG